MIAGTKYFKDKLSNFFVKIEDEELPKLSEAKNLDVVIDEIFTFQYISNKIKKSFKRLILI